MKRNSYLEEVCGEVEETLEQFDELAFYVKEKKRIKKALEEKELSKKKRELTKKAREEVLEGFGIKNTEDADESPYLSSNCLGTSEVSDEYYKQLVDDINRLVTRNTQIIAIFTDKEAVKDVVKNYLSGTMVEEYLNNEATLHTLLDRIQSINISVRHGENFENSKFGPVSKRMSDQ